VITPDVVRQQVVIEELDVAPDGRNAVIVRRSVAGLEYRRALWLIPLSGGRPCSLTVGLPGDSHPRFSPDGRMLGFLSARRDSADGDGAGRGSRGTRRDTHERTADEPQTDVWVLPLEGGEPWRLTRSPHGVRGFAWSPDGARIAFWGPVDPSGILVGERGSASTPTARRITTGGWRADEAGFVDHRVHLSVVAARPGARAWQLTRGDFDVSAPAWDVDGRSIVFCAARHENADLFPRPSVHRVRVETDGPRWPGESGGVEPVEIVRLRGLVESVTPSPDGRWLALVGVDVDGAPDDAGPSLYLVPMNGSGEARELAPSLDLPVGAWVDTDLHGWTSGARWGPWWVHDREGAALVALTSRRGRCVPWRYPLDPETGTPVGRPAPLVEAECACWAVAAGGGSLAVLGTLDGRAMEVMTVRDGTLRTVSRLGSAWQRRFSQPAMVDLEIRGPGGTIETWLASPPGAGETPLPLVVDIHGGPLGAWAPAPSLEVQMLVSAGYRVALPNIRGSAGYGAEWIRPHMGHWGEVDADDVLAVVDHLVAAGLADSDRLGLLGLSYGGFLVNWLVGAAPDRFAAAVSEAGVTNQIAAWALSDTGPDYNRRARMGDPLTPDGVQLLWRQSPLRHVAAVRTPLLLLQGEADQRCPAADNEQLFAALRALGRTVEYVLYPESHHVYAMAGRPDRRIDRHTRMLEWFRRHLA
jgi:dipeptidyl aminopeptidase/acylaminoacyl peptidase